jgi:hypothetical protein
LQTHDFNNVPFPFSVAIMGHYTSVRGVMDRSGATSVQLCLHLAH